MRREGAMIIIVDDDVVVFLRREGDDVCQGLVVSTRRDSCLVDLILFHQSVDCRYLIWCATVDGSSYFRMEFRFKGKMCVHVKNGAERIHLTLARREVYYHTVVFCRYSCGTIKRH